MSKRELLKTVYKTETWHRRVDAMPDEQIYAIYTRFVRERKLP